MITRTTLREEPNLQSMRIRGGGDWTINQLKDIVEKSCFDNGLNVLIDVDTVTSGKLFDKSVLQCIVIKNADHQLDYFYEVITMKTQGLYAFVDFYYGGSSKNNKRIAAGNVEHSTITGSIFGAIKKAMVSNDAIEEETNYYAMLCDAISIALDSISI